MDPARNPYAPNAGAQPPELAGRDRILIRAETALTRIMQGRSDRGQMLLGLRGAGKTVLLNRIHRAAVEQHYQTIRLEAPEGGKLLRILLPELRTLLYQLDVMKRAEAALKRSWRALRNLASAFKISFEGFDFGVSEAPGLADTGDLERDLPQLLAAIAEAARVRETAIGLFIDEIQYLKKEELAALIVSCHQAAQTAAPILLLGAGLPQIAGLAGAAKSYAERLFEYPVVGPLDREAAKAALVAPAEREGVTFRPDAADAVLDVTRRYPYFLQEWGSHLWNAAEDEKIDATLVETTTPAVIRHLDENFFKVRLNRLTPLEEKYLRGMAELGEGPHQTGEIAAALQSTATALATTRKRLIEKGMIWGPRHAETAFTVPMFDGFMRRRMPTLEPHIPQTRGKT